MRPLLIAIVLGNLKILPIRRVLQTLHSILILPEYYQLLLGNTGFILDRVAHLIRKRHPAWGRRPDKITHIGTANVQALGDERIVAIL